MWSDVKVFLRLCEDPAFEDCKNVVVMELTSTDLHDKKAPAENLFSLNFNLKSHKMSGL